MNEWYVYIHMKNGADVLWSGRFKRFTALVMRASFYQTEGRAEAVAKKLRASHPGEDIRVRKVGT